MPKEDVRPKKPAAKYIDAIRGAISGELAQAGISTLDERHERAVIEAAARSAAKVFLDHHATSMRLRRVLSHHLTEIEETNEALPDAGALDALLADVDPATRRAIYSALMISSRVEVTTQVVNAFSKLVNVDKELLNIVLPSDNDGNTIEQEDVREEEARIRKLAEKFNLLVPSIEMSESKPDGEASDPA